MMASSVTIQELALNQLLNKEKHKFSDFREVGEEIVQQVYEAVSKSPNFKVNRALLAGSIGKKTWLGTRHRPDFDIVILLNQPLKLSPTDILEEIAQIIRRIPTNSSYTFRHKKTTTHTVQFACNTRRVGDLEFDVVPGLNWVDDPGKDSHHGETQLNRTWKEIIRLGGDVSLKKAFQESPFLNASLAEYVRDFVRDQDTFTHDVVKLVKLWNRTMIATLPKISGRSYAMEIVGIYSAEQETKQRGENGRKLVEAFKKALEVFALPRSRIQIVLQFPKGGNTTQMAVRDKYYLMNRSGAVILDPTNPFNNLLDNFADEQLAEFRRKALVAIGFINRGDKTILNCFNEFN